MIDWRLPTRRGRDVRAMRSSSRVRRHGSVRRAVDPRTENAWLIEVVVAGFGWLLLSAVRTTSGRAGSRRGDEGARRIGRGSTPLATVRSSGCGAGIGATGRSRGARGDTQRTTYRTRSDGGSRTFRDRSGSTRARPRIDSGELRTIECMQNPCGGNYSFFMNRRVTSSSRASSRRCSRSSRRRAPSSSLEAEIDGERAGDDEDRIAEAPRSMSPLESLLDRWQSLTPEGEAFT